MDTAKLVKVVKVDELFVVVLAECVGEEGALQMAQRRDCDDRCALMLIVLTLPRFFCQTLAHHLLQLSLNCGQESSSLLAGR